MYNRLFLVAALTAGCSLFAPAGAAGRDSDLCDNFNADSAVRIAACTRIVSAGIAAGRDLARAYYHRGMAQRDERHYDQAIDDFSSAIKVDPGWSWPYVARGHAYAKKREFARAFEDQETALRIEPTAVTFVGRAKDLIDAGDYDRAMTDLDEALRLNPNYIFAFVTRGDVHIKKREFAKAISDYNKALEIAANTNNSNISNGALEYIRTQIKEARSHLGQ